MFLLMVGAQNSTWAAKVTYHILTLPIDPSTRYDYHMKSDVTGHRLEAFKVVVDNQNTVELPAHYKSPLATGFTYYEPKDITGHGSSAVSLYDGVSSRKGILYEVKASPTPVAEGTAITTSTAEYYVVYTYNESNTIAKLDGTVNYNIGVKGKGFLSLNRGRNNRPAVIPTAKADPEMLASLDFSYVDSPGNNIGTYWSDGNNKNSRDSTESKFFFGFKLEGKDPYHIVIRTSYARDYTFIEKNEDGDKAFVYKWYKGAALMAKTTGNAYLASDDHVRYKTTYSEGSANPTDPASDAKTGYFHGNDQKWGTVALLNNTSNTGYVFMGTRNVDDNGNIPGPKDNTKYYYLTFSGYNNLNFNQITSADATKSHTIDGFYPLKKVTFKIVTPFYKANASTDHIVSATDWVSQYTVDNDTIETKYLPTSLRRKYCNFTGKFYSDATCETKITKFSEANYDNTEGYQVYIGYEVTSDIPFKAITPAATYTASTWTGATWYELTDEGSTKDDDLRLKYDDTNFKNNGAKDENVKTSEFAFIGDPYELRVVLRSATSGASPSYVGATGTPPTTGTLLTASTTASEGYKWELPADATAGSFLLRKYKGTGNWYWNAGHPSPVAISYSTKTHTYNVATANAQTVTFNVSNLGYTEGDYIKVTAGGTNPTQVTVTSDNIHVQTDGTASFTAAIKARGGSDKTFTLSIQKYNSSDVAQGAASVVTVNQNVTTYTANTVEYSTASSTRVKVLTLPEVNVIYNIVDTNGDIAIKATVKQTVFSPLLGYASIPDSIRSPFIYGEDITFWSTYSDGTCSNEIHETSNTNGYNVYVKYTLAHLAEKNIKLNSSQRFKVKLNKEYIYYNSTESKILSTAAIGEGYSYSWTLEGGDPYAMKIANVGNSGKYVKVDGGTWGNNKSLTFVEGIANGSRFIAMSSLYTGIYEVMAATGTKDYYHIGRPSSSGAETKIYNLSTYAHGVEQLQFELAGEDAITYHLIDKADNELLTASSYNPRLTLPAEYVSPLVGEYYYYPTRAKATTNLEGNRITEISQDTKEDGTQEGGKGDNHVYVTYIANDRVNFGKGQYMLKFLEPLAAGYHLEDGNDKLTSDKIQAVYPYCNGDGNMNIYGDRMQKEQFGGGANTRPRWVWYFDSDNKDPYHVTIRSRSTIKYNDVSHYTYLTTHVVHFNQDAEGVKKVVTGGTLPTIASINPTEYMVLGTVGNYRLMTTNTIDDGTTNVRRNVTSLEQYWKTYNMIKLDVLGIAKSTNAYSDDATTWVVPTDKRAELQTKLGEKGVGTGQWHSYNAYANATRWNGFNDKSDGEEKKVVENLEHWYQTFDMGTGIFDIESADIPPVLVLLDRHGWEIMRRPLPTTNYPEGDVELAALRVYDSPLVDKYYFYNNATKASGCHKYTLRMQDGKERDQIKLNGVHYSSSSLGDLPPRSASGVVSGGAIQDFYVTYTVKEEYESKYAYELDYDEIKDGDKVTGYTINSETGTSQPYLVLQNGRFYKAENTLATGEKESYFTKPISEHTNPEGGNVYDLIVSPKNHGGTNNNIIDGSGNFIGNNFWLVKPNLYIDEEMGIKWGTAISGAEPLSKVATQVTYKDKSGFDPYNIQLQLVKDNSGENDGRYLTTHMTSARLEDGIMIGDYSGGGGSMKITLEAAFTDYRPNVDKGSEGYDHTNLQISNQTFMAVSDANGNMQLMPRFDHTHRVHLPGTTPWHNTLSDPEDHALASADDNASMGPQTTFFVSPQRFHYHIIDNNGREALRYKRGADSYPAITNHFKSPLAKDFVYYTGLAESEDYVVSSAQEWGQADAAFKRSLTRDTLSAFVNAVKLLPTAGIYYYRIGTRGQFSYRKVEVTKGLSEKKITGSFAAAKLSDVDNDVYVRYSYDEDADHDGDHILLGKWFTVDLAEKNLQANGTVVLTEGATQGTGVSLYAGNESTLGDDNDKPGTINASAMKWQWKFLQAPTDPSSDYYVEPDPYALQIFNRQANYTSNPSLEPSPMAVGIKVPSADNGANRFALLSHPSGGYAFVVAKEYDNTYDYKFLNGADMTIPSTTAATTASEANFNYKTGTLTTGSQVVLNNDVEHNFTYNVITNAGKLAITATQNNAEAESHDFDPYLPESAQSPLLNMTDYLYYGFASRPGGDYSVIPQTILYTLYGLYDDVAYVRYNAYDVNNTPFKVPNKKDIVDSHVARDANSVDVAMNIDGGLPYNIIWYNDNMMQSTDDAAVSDGGSHALSGSRAHVWYFTENDPYALKIKHKGGKYLNGTTTMVAKDDAPTFMLLRKDDHDYGVLQLTGTTGADAGKKLTGYGGALTADAITDPTKYVIFGLSIHNLIYHLVIANTCPNKASPQAGQYVDIDYRTEISGTLGTKRIYGTTQRDLTSIDDEDDPHKLPGDKYQLGETLSWGNPATYHTYSYDAGQVSIGDELVVPTIFYRPNCLFDYYVEGIYRHTDDSDNGTPYTAMENKYKGLQLTGENPKLMSDEELIDQTVVINLVYKFDPGLATNAGLDFVTSVGQNLWYTFETQSGETPYLAHYTNAWGLQSMEGRETRYTNDYLWTPLGDVYGFKLYNRYMIKNSDGSDKVMTFAGTVEEGKNLAVAEPGSTVDAKTYTAGNEIFELISGDADGYFRVHPVVNTGAKKYYVKRDASDSNYAKLSTTPSDWTFGLDMSLLEPYYVRAGYVGGLNDTGKAAYKTEIDKGEGNYRITDLQNIVYNDANIVEFSKGYYRMHSVPGTPGIAPVRYASGYLHEIEKTAGTSSTPIPMHFYSKAGVTGTFDGDLNPLESGFTETDATRGDIPVPATEYDPSTIFYLNGGKDPSDRDDNVNPRVIISTQGLYVKGNATDSDHGDAVMTATSGEATKFSLIDIGGAVLLITNELTPATRNYLHYGQGANIYDLKYYHNSPTNEARWCLAPADSLIVTMNNGGDGYYYSTFCAPFDVLLPDDVEEDLEEEITAKDYNAYICKKWYDTGVHPVKVPAVTGATSYDEGKFVPAGTPVIFRIKDESGSMKLTLPSTEPAAAISSCIFTGKYLEQLLPLDEGDKWLYDVYTLGLPFSSDVDKDGDYNTTGDIVAPLPEQATSGVGFYINATSNKEHNASKARWDKNNRYVLHNKIYYREDAAPGASARGMTRSGVEFVPLIFDDLYEDNQNGDMMPSQTPMGDGCVYDMQGRRVANVEQVLDGTWKQRVAPGIYIINGKKLLVE